MNKHNLLITIIFSGAIAGIFAWAFYSGYLVETFPLNNSTYMQEADGANNTKEFEPLEKTSSTPAEVNDSVLVELDGYIKAVDATGSEDISDLE